MNRREFMHLMGLAGIGYSLPMTLQPAHAMGTEHFWVTVHAGGGWDPTSLCDPKGDAPRSDGRGPVNHYAAANIKQMGNIRYAPAPTLDESNLTAEQITEVDTTFDAFFANHFQRLLVINGIDTETNSHSIGTRHTWSGKSDMGHPAFAALTAAAVAPDRPMSFISNGGYDFTASLVASSRVAGSDVFNRLAFPNEPSPGNNDRYIEDAVYQRLRRARRDALTAEVSRRNLPARRVALEKLMLVANGEASLSAIVDRLPDDRSNGLRGQAELAAAAFASGLSVSANLSSGGFDTHGDHDRRHFPNMAELLDGVDHLWRELERQGIADRTTVVVGSDFGRTPFYNGGNGKDHWNVTSVMMMGAGIHGDRVIGATDSLVRAVPVNADTLEPDPGGITITPRHVHKALRRLAGLSGSALDQDFFIAETELPLLA